MSSNGQQWTPGPWVADSKNETVITATRNNKLALICQSMYDESNEPTLEELYANARLIAAAPALYEALVKVVAIADRQTIEFDEARAALRLVDGEGSEPL